MTFSQKLKYILSEQNISQAELSRLTGINKSSICQYLSGKNIPSKEETGRDCYSNRDARRLLWKRKLQRTKYTIS